MRTNYHTTEKNAADSLDDNFSTVKTDLHHKPAFLLEFFHPGKDRQTLHCNLPDGRRIVLDRIFNPRLKIVQWRGSIVSQKTGEQLFAGKKILIGWGNSWSVAVGRVIGIPQFWHNKSGQWLSFYDLGKPHFVHPKHEFDFGYKKPSKIGEIPTQAMLNSIQHKNASKRPSRAFLRHPRPNKAVYNGWNNPHIGFEKFKPRKWRQKPIRKHMYDTPAQIEEDLIRTYEANPTYSNWLALNRQINKHLLKK